MLFLLNGLEENRKMKLNANKTGLGNSYAPVLHYWNKTLTITTRSLQYFKLTWNTDYYKCCIMYFIIKDNLLMQ